MPTGSGEWAGGTAGVGQNGGRLPSYRTFFNDLRNGIRFLVFLFFPYVCGRGRGSEEKGKKLKTIYAENVFLVSVLCDQVFSLHNTTMFFLTSLP